MKAIFIDASKRKIKQIDIPGENPMESIYTLLEAQSACIGHTLENGDTMYVDANGESFPTDSFFFMAGMERPVPMSAIIIGENSGGDFIDCQAEADDIQSMVEFMNRNQATFFHALKGDARNFDEQ